MPKGRSIKHVLADATATRPPPPRGLAPMARQFWLQFTAAMPASAFAAIDLPALRRLSELSAWRYQLGRRLDGLTVEERMEKTGKELHKQVAELDRAILAHERALRLSATSRSDSRAAGRRARGQDGLFQGEDPDQLASQAILAGRFDA